MVFKYPQTHKVEQFDDYHGTPVADPYRWLEDTDSPETEAWVQAQNKVTFAYLESLPQRERLRQRLTELWDFPKALAPELHGGRYFQLRNSGLQNQDVLYVMDSLDGEPRLLLDPNTLSEDGTVALTAWAVSKDGRWLAYATSAAGSDWLRWRVRSVDTGQDLDDVIEWSKFSGAAWLPDTARPEGMLGFFYARYDAPQEGEEFAQTNYFQKLYFHKLGDPQSADRLAYDRPDQKEWGFDASVSDDGRYLVVHVWQGTDRRNRLFYQDLHTGAPVIELISELEAAYHFVGNDGPVFYLRSDLDAPRARLIAIDTRQPDRENWREVIPEGEDTLEMVKMVGERFAALYLHNAHHLIRLFTLDGSPDGQVALPTLGSVNTVYGPSLSGERQHRQMYYVFSSFVHPMAVFEYDFDRRASRAIFVPPIRFDFSPYETRQVFASSKDGTQVPMFVVHRKDIKLDGDNPTLLYGYGGFNIALTPAFAVSRLAWLEMGGVLAVANLRGGNEFGEAWHEAGTIHKKQNVFDDFIACAEHLIASGITRPRRLAIQGGSNGGLLVGACMTQRPELFAAAQPAVGVMDMLRFHKFTIGWAWVSDYGSSDDPEQFKTLLKYSPLHNLRHGVRYPATLVTTADHDDRVVPGHSFKFAAALQEAHAGEDPVLIRIQVRAGHGFGKPTTILIAEQADIWAFLAANLGM